MEDTPARMKLETTYKWRVIPCILVLLILWGCRREPTRWDMDLAIPLLDVEWGWANIVGDSASELEPGAPGVLRFEAEVGRMSMDELAFLPDTVVENILTPAFVGGPFEVPPGAVLLDEQQDIIFQGIEQEFTSMTLSQGMIQYLVRSKTDGWVHLRYDFPSVTIHGEPVVLDVLLPPSVDGGNQQEIGFINLESAVIDFTGSTGQEVNRINSNLTIGTPADIDYTANVYGDDSIKVQMWFHKMRVEEVEGYFGQVDIALDEAEEAFSAQRFPTGSFVAAPTAAELKLYNTMGADLAFWVDTLKLDDENLMHPSIGQEQVLSRADWSVTPPAFDFWSLNLLDCTPNFFESLGSFPDSVHLIGDLQLNPMGDATAGHDYFSSLHPPYVTLDVELPLSLGFSGVMIRDSIEVQGLPLKGFDGELVMRVSHDFPVAWSVEGHFEDNGGNQGSYFEADLPISEATVEWRIPMDGEQLSLGGVMPLAFRLDTDGQVLFSGEERVHIQVALEGRYEAVIE